MVHGGTVHFVSGPVVWDTVMIGKLSVVGGTD